MNGIVVPAKMCRSPPLNIAPVKMTSFGNSVDRRDQFKGLDWIRRLVVISDARDP